jgi:hypothetical protein
VAILNALIGRLLDVLLAPVRGLPPLVGLAVCSMFMALLVVLLFRVSTDPRRLRAVGRQLQAAIFEMRLFQDDIRAVLRAAGEALGHQIAYVRLVIVPLSAAAVLLTPVLGQLHALYGYEGLVPGRPVLVTAQLNERSADMAQAVALEAPEGVEVQTPAVWIPATREVVWRLTPSRPGACALHVVVGGERFSKTLDASPALIRRSPVRTAGGVLDQIRYPAERPLPAGGPLTSIRLDYPDRRLDVVGWRLHWTVVVLVITMGAALVLARWLRVRMW